MTPEHSNLETEVKRFLEEHNYYVYEATYHRLLPSKIKELLQNRWSLTALYLRGRADRVAIHQRYPLEFEFECKTHSNNKYEDWTIEFLPLVHHLSKSKLGVECLYIYKHLRGEELVAECGFWVKNLPLVRTVWIPPKRTTDTQWYTSLANLWFPDIEITFSYASGSADPFLIIDSSVVKKLPNWKELIPTFFDSNATDIISNMPHHFQESAFKKYWQLKDEGLSPKDSLNRILQERNP